MFIAKTRAANMRRSSHLGNKRGCKEGVSIRDVSTTALATFFFIELTQTDRQRVNKFG